MPITPELMHCYHVNEITSEVSLKKHWHENRICLFDIVLKIVLCL